MLVVKKILTYLILITCCGRSTTLAQKIKLECGYKQCPQTREGALNVHLVPHSHMDAGWVKTFDEYYFGTKTSASTANVQMIYHTVLSELLHDKRRKFTFAETAYFWRWWKEQRPATRSIFRSLVQEGRVEFAGGGWVQNDESTAHYLQIIDQFTWGLRKINDTLGPCGKPKAAWQIDTYGHTREQTSLLAQMGYDGLFIGRVDHKEREAMMEEDRLEFMWRGSDVLGKMSDIMTHTLFNLYNAPDGFCFDILCSDEPIVDDPDSRVYNAEKRVNDFIQHIERQAKYYDHDNIMVTMGGDFMYHGAAGWFMNMDTLINHVNSHPGNITDVNIFYSTPSCYLKAIYLYGRRDKAIFTERDDQLPYGSDPNTYWTGFYTSRPALKYFIRRVFVFLQVVKQLTVAARLSDSFELHLLRHAVNLVLHHDAITGTSQQHVIIDFIRLLSEGIEACSKKLSTVLSYLTPTWGSSRRTKNHQQFVVCHQLNMSHCRFAETQESMVLIVYNPLSVKTYHHVRIPAVALHYTIRDAIDEEVEYQLVPLPAAVINLPGRSSAAIQELCFEAENIPPLGFAAYWISPVRDQLEENAYAKRVNANKNIDANEELVPTISNEYLKVSVNKDTGLLESIQHVDGVKIQVEQNFYFYNQSQQTLQSGAYSFRPEKNRPFAVTDRVTYLVMRGLLVKEIRQRFADWITQVVRLYRGEEFVELEWIIGPVPIGTDLGKEVVSVFKTNISNNGVFYTDSNGRQMMKRSCWNETSSQRIRKPVAACYYPVTTRICLQSQTNSTAAMCILTDRTQGGTSYIEGEVELMAHRRLLTDDGFGLEESLNEEAYGVGLVVRGKHRIFFGNYMSEIEDLTFMERAAQASRRWLLEPWCFMSSGEKINRRKWQVMRTKRFSALKLHGLPRHVHVLTLEPWKGGSVLLRLENTLEKPNRGPFHDSPDSPDDYTTRSSHITVQLRQIFLQMRIRMVRETTLAGNQWLDDARQMDWSTRYVYNGADDESLPEDAAEEKEYEEAKPARGANARADPPTYSDEDMDSTHRRYPTNPQKERSKFQRSYVDSYRRKRQLSVNDTVRQNINENITNGLSKGVNSSLINNNRNKTDETSRHFQIEPELAVVNYKNNTTSKIFNVMKETYEPSLDFKGANNYVGKVGPISNFRREDSTRFPSAWARDSEETLNSEGYDFPNRKRLIRRKDKKTKRVESESSIDRIDDGVTRSIYDMYYKSSTRSKAFSSNGDEIEIFNPRRSQKKNYRSIKNDEFPSTERQAFRSKTGFRRGDRQKNRRGKAMKMFMPYFVSKRNKARSRKRRPIADTEERMREEYQERRAGREESIRSPRRENVRTKQRKNTPEDYGDHFVSEDYEMTDNDYGERRTRADNRKKRDAETPSWDQIEENEPEYVITLRPTQIRTFVVWFDSPKKPFVI